MNITNIECKASCTNIQTAEDKLLSKQPVFAGEDNQTDTYFNVKKGRLKLREGNIENALIWYNRADADGAKRSEIILYKHVHDDALKNILTASHGIKVAVKKIRRIYFIKNVKFHFDRIEGLGSFIEIEAIDDTGNMGEEKLKAQCDFYISFFGIKSEDFIKVSYSDMLISSGS